MPELSKCHKLRDKLNFIIAILLFKQFRRKKRPTFASLIVPFEVRSYNLSLNASGRCMDKFM